MKMFESLDDIHKAELSGDLPTSWEWSWERGELTDDGGRNHEKCPPTYHESTSHLLPAA
jgi:hypothetical protein